MPTLKVARKEAGSNSAYNADFGSVWSILNYRNITHEGQGLYCYVGAGGTGEDDVGVLRTKYPLDPNRMGGMSSFEITLTSTG